jgi:hypothetical protein
MRIGRTLAALAALALAAEACIVVDLDFYVTTTGGTSSSSTSSTGSTSSTSSGSVCTLGTTRSCYSGPAGTEGQGICKAGMQACAANGMGWGPCDGEVLPQPENCATPEDEDCDGKAPPCKGALLWAERFGSVSDQIATGVATDAAGNIVLGGYFNAAIDFGGGPLVSMGGVPGLDDVFVAKLDPNGGHLWSKRFGDAKEQAAQSIGVDVKGNVLVAGSMAGAMDLGGGALTSAGGTDIFIAKLDPNGGHLWSSRFGDAQDQLAQGITGDSGQNVLVTGSFHGVVDFGGGALTSAGSTDLFIAKLDPNGGHLWSKRFGDASEQIGKAIAIDNMGNVLVTGSFSGVVDFGGGPLASASGTDIFIAKLDPNGAHLWSQRFGGAGDGIGEAIAIDSVGNVLVTGSFSGVVDFGGGPLTSAGGTDIFVAKFDPNGAHLWSQRFGDAADQEARSIATDGSQNVLATGVLGGAADFGGGPLASAGSTDVFVVKLDPSGAYLWGKRFGDANPQVGTGITADGAGQVILTGYFGGSTDFGGGALMSMGSSDVFIAKFGP